MKREKISLFILVLEIALITLLHSAKNQKPGGDKAMINTGASIAQPPASFVSF